MPCPYCGCHDSTRASSPVRGARLVECRGCQMKYEVTSNPAPPSAAADSSSDAVQRTKPYIDRVPEHEEDGSNDPRNAADAGTSPSPQNASPAGPVFEDLGIAHKIAEFLREGGFLTRDQVASATDSQLVDLKGLGVKSVAAIRAVIPHTPPPADA